MSEEQGRVVDLFCQGRNVVVTAVAGAGKSTLLLHICERYEDERVALVAFNAPLAFEMNHRIEELGLMNARAYTFHSLASKVLRLCPDDNTLADLLADLRAGRIDLSEQIEVDHLLLDEMQDMKDIFYELLRQVFDLKSMHTLVCGDAEQMLYHFETDDPAKLDYMEHPERFFGTAEWDKTRLSTSFRLTKPLAELVNSVKDGQVLIPGNCGEPRDPVIVTCGMFQWTEKLMPYLLEMVRTFRRERIAILVRSVRTTHPAVRTFVNGITSRKIPVYVHGVDSSTATVRNDKITVCTYHAAKGLTFDACITIGISEDTEHNPMYVALSRSKCMQVVVLDRLRPPRRLLRALGDGLSARACFQTRMFVKNGYRNPDEIVGLPSMQDLTKWSPRGRATELHTAVRMEIVSVAGASRLPVDVTTRVHDLTEEVSMVYVIASLCAEEHRLTGTCNRLQHVQNPVRLSLTQRKRKLADGDHSRFVDDRAQDEELFPHRLRALLAASLEHPQEAVQWCAVAVASMTFGEYHHLAERLLPSLDWVDVSFFESVRARVAEHVNESVEFDRVARHVGSVTLSFCRCDVVSKREAKSFVYEDRLSCNAKLRACTAMVLDESIDRCTLVNVRTGECVTMTVTDREVFRARMEL